MKTQTNTTSQIISLLAIIFCLMVPQLASANGVLEYSSGLIRVGVRPERTAIATRIQEQIAVTVLTQRFSITDSIATSVRFGMPVSEAVTITGIRYRYGAEWRTAVIASSDTNIHSGSTGGPRSSQNFLNAVGTTGFVFPLRDTLRGPILFEIEVTMVELLPQTAGRVQYQLPLETLRMYYVDSLSWSLSIRTKNAMTNVDVVPNARVVHSNTGNEYVIQERRISCRTNPKVSFALTHEAFSVTMLSAKPAGDDGYALLLATPATDYASSILPKRFTFVIDRSGSMQGKKMEDAKNGALYCLQRVSPFDEVNVVEFDDRVTSVWIRPQPATPANLSSCVNFVSGLLPRGGTNIMNALITSFRSYSDTNFVNIIIFLTDGEAPIDHAELLRENTKSTRVFVFGVGDKVNYTSLQRIAVDHGGEVVFVGNGSASTAIATLFQRIKDPLFKNPTLSYSPDVLFDFAPLNIPDIYAGDQLIVASRYRTPGLVDAVLAGSNIIGRHEEPFRVVLADEDTTSAFVPKLWARMRINVLLGLMSTTSPNSDLWREYRDEIIRLGKSFGIVTKFTTFEQGTDNPNTTSVIATDGPIAAAPVVAFPNPMRTYTKLSTTFDYEHADVQISVCDIRGAAVADISAGYCAAGTWNFELRIDAFARALAPGIYIITVRAGDEVRTITITVEG